MKNCIENYCKKLDVYLDIILKKRNTNRNYKPVITTVLCILVIVIVGIIFHFLLNKMPKNNSCLFRCVNTYTWVFIVSFGVTIIMNNILLFDGLDEKQISVIRIAFKVMFSVFVLCVIPVLIINFILEKIFGENNDIVFLFIYLGLEICFILFLLVIPISIMVKFNINFTSNLNILIIAIIVYLLSMLWFYIYKEFLNFEDKDNSEIRKAHNMISYITIFLVFIINNYILNNNDIIACAVNDAIQAITLLVLIFEERMAKCNKNNKQ